MLGSTWAVDCRVMCTMEYLARKNATDTFFSLHTRNIGRTLSLLFVFFLHVVWRRVTKAPLAGNSFETEAKIEASQGGLI